MWHDVALGAHENGSLTVIPHDAVTTANLPTFMFPSLRPPGGFT